MICIRTGKKSFLSGLARTLLVLSSCLLCISLGTGSSAAKPTRCFGTALVFAIDASGSIDDEEYILQMAGLANALREPDVANAIQNAGGVALAAVVWSDTAFATRTIEWQSILSLQDLHSFAQKLQNLPRVGGGGTDLGQGIWSALDLLDDPTLCAIQRVIDVSGDGRETLYPRRRHSASLFSARRRAEDSGVVINGLAIVSEEPDLERYYLENVVTGPDAFVILAESFDDFGDAIKAKLLREITPVKQAQLQPEQHPIQSTE